MQIRGLIVKAIKDKQNELLKELLAQITHEEFRKRDNDFDRKSFLQHAVDVSNTEAIKILHEKDCAGMTGKSSDDKQQATVFMLNEKSPITALAPLHEIVMRCMPGEREIKECDECLRMFQELNADFNINDNRGRNAILIAIVYNNSYLIEQLAELGCDINGKDFEGETVYDYAANKYGIHDRIFELLSKLGAKTDIIKGSHIRERVLSRLQQLTLEVDPLTVLHGKNPNTADRFGRTPFFHLISRNAEEALAYLNTAYDSVLQPLLADVTIKTKLGNALHIALSQTNLHLGLIDKLVELGCSLTELNDDRQTPIQIAENRGCISYLIESQHFKKAYDEYSKSVKQTESVVSSVQREERVPHFTKINSIVQTILAGNRIMYNRVMQDFPIEYSNLIMNALDEAIKSGKKVKNAVFYNEVLTYLKANDQARMMSTTSSANGSDMPENSESTQPPHQNNLSGKRKSTKGKEKATSEDEDSDQEDMSRDEKENKRNKKETPKYPAKENFDFEILQEPNITNAIRYSDLPNSTADLPIMVSVDGDMVVCELRKKRVTEEESTQLIAEVSRGTGERKLQVLMLRECEILSSQVIINLFEIFQFEKIQMWNCKISDASLLELGGGLRESIAEKLEWDIIMKMHENIKNTLNGYANEKLRITILGNIISINSTAVPTSSTTEIISSLLSHANDPARNLLIQRLESVVQKINKGEPIFSEDNSTFQMIYQSLLANIDNVRLVANDLLSSNVIRYNEATDDFFSMSNPPESFKDWMTMNGISDMGTSSSPPQQEAGHFEIVEPDFPQTVMSEDMQLVLPEDFLSFFAGQRTLPPSHPPRPDLEKDRKKDNDEGPSPC